VASQVHTAAVTPMAEVNIDVTPVEPKALTTDTVKSSDAVITIGCGDIQHRHTTNAKPSKPVPVA
jgi:arsenate reductase (thioredoxin)